MKQHPPYRPNPGDRPIFESFILTSNYHKSLTLLIYPINQSGGRTPLSLNLKLEVLLVDILDRIHRQGDGVFVRKSSKLEQMKE